MTEATAYKAASQMVRAEVGARSVGCKNNLAVYHEVAASEYTPERLHHRSQ